MNDFLIIVLVTNDDGIGGSIQKPQYFWTVQGYLDMLQGTTEDIKQNAFVQESTHVLILPNYNDGVPLTADMLVIDNLGNQYVITYCDDPVGAHHHWEIYLTFQKKTEIPSNITGLPSLDDYLSFAQRMSAVESSVSDIEANAVNLEDIL